VGIDSKDLFPQVRLESIHNGQDNDEGGYSEENADDGDEGDDGNEDLLPLRPQISQTDEEFIGHSVALSNLPGVSSGERG